MITQTINFIQVSEMAEQAIAFGRKHHWRFRIIPDFQGVIDRPIYNSNGAWIYMPLREQDKVIIPKAAFRRHALLEKAGYRVSQVIIGHEIKIAADEPEETLAAPTVTKEIDWSNLAEVAGKGLLVAMMGIGMIALYALTGAFQLLDPSYCIVLAGDDNPGTVIELIRWNLEA